MNPLYNQLMQGRGVTPTQNGSMGLSSQAQQFAVFAQNFRQMTNNMNPQQFAQQLLNSGQLNQAQLNVFNQCCALADQIMGTHH